VSGTSGTVPSKAQTRASGGSNTHASGTYRSAV